jgi:hypothetical protein
MGIYVTYEFSCLKQNVLISASDVAHIRASPVRTCMRAFLIMHRHAYQPAETLHNSVRNSSMQQSFLWFTIDTIRPKVFNPSQQMGISSSFPLVSEPIPRDTDVSEIQQTLSLLDLFLCQESIEIWKSTGFRSFGMLWIPALSCRWTFPYATSSSEASCSRQLWRSGRVSSTTSATR